jgi:DNA-binding GntR family transcriptional regulator
VASQDEAGVTTEVEVARSARAVAYEALQRGIAGGQYPPGSWLREEDVAAAAGVSRTPVREALHRLQAEGVVQILHNRGAVVVGWTAQDLDDIYDLRVLLEGYGVRRVAQAPDNVDFVALRAMCTEMEQLLPEADEQDLQRIGQLCIDFHTTLAQASQNRQLLAIIPTVLATPFVREAFHHHTPADLEHAFASHREILEALDIGDGDWAEGVMRAHLRAGRHSLREMEQERRTGGIDDDPSLATA